MALYLWFLCLCLLIVIACTLLFIFNESLKNGALTTAGFIFILFTIERAVDKTGLHLFKGKTKTVHQWVLKKKVSLEVCVWGFANEEGINELNYSSIGFH